MTIEEIKTELGKTPELKTALLSSFKDDFIKGAEAEGMIVRTKEQDQQFLDNHVKTVVDTEVGKQLQPKVDAEFSKMMAKIDDHVKSLTSIERNPNEKTLDYAKRALEAAKAKGGDPVTKEKVAELESLVASTKKEYEEKLTAKESELFKTLVDFEIGSALDKVNIALPATLKTDEDKANYANQQKALIKAGLLGSVTYKKDNEGKIVFYEGDKPLMNTKDGKPKNASDIINEKYASWFIPQSQPGAGAGGNPPQGGAGSFKSKDDIHIHLATQGVAVGSKEYLDTFEKLATDNKISI